MNVIQVLTELKPALDIMRRKNKIKKGEWQVRYKNNVYIIKNNN